MQKLLWFEIMCKILGVIVIFRGFFVASDSFFLILQLRTMHELHTHRPKKVAC
jgi:hypothetical protein